MNWRKPVIHGLLYLRGSKILQYLKEISTVDNFSLNEKQEYQKEKLKIILLHAYNNVPYYHKILGESAVVVAGKVNLDNFHKIPVLTKDILRREFNNLKSKDINRRKWKYNTSGGSTGEPVRFIQDKEYEDWNFANKIYYKTFVNQEIGDKELRLWGSERDLLEGKEKFSIRIRNRLYNRKELNAFKMSEREMKLFVIKWNRYRPSWIESYAQPMYEFARFIKNNNLKIFSPKAILTSAGTLYPEMKKLIKEVFRCEVFNRYGSREIGDAACSRDGSELHLSPWNQYIEVLDVKLSNSKPGKFGKIYATTLNNYSMPLIRYDIGDIAVPSHDRFILKKLEGRVMSVFKTRNGKIVPAEFFIHFIGVVYNENIISKFQVVQEDYERILIKAVLKDEKKFESHKKRIEVSIKKVMGKDCVVSWKFLDDIPSTNNGKYLYTVSNLK